jgi:cytochrome P450
MQTVQAPKSAKQIASMPLASIDLSLPELFQNDTIEHYFARLRDESPVHYCENSRYGPYWSITRYDDIMHVDTNHKTFSSDAHRGGITIVDLPKGLERKNFINMDPPEHDAHRKTVSPIVAPANLAALESTIRERVVEILDALPRGETFDWVDRVSIELTTRMLATLFDFPFEQRRLLTEWSDIVTTDLSDENNPINTEAERIEALKPCLTFFTRLFEERAAQPRSNDLVSMLAHGQSTKNMSPQELLSTMILLIVGGNDTTRNSLSGGLLALNENPEQWQKLRDDPKLVSSLVPEIIRWQTPLAHMRRTTLHDTEVAGQAIPANSKVVMWYLSGNRDERSIENPHSFIVDRKRPRQHLSFGFGVHRCVGNRLAEMQLRIAWEEILKRDMNIRVTGTPQRAYSNIVHGFTELPVQIQ